MIQRGLYHKHGYLLRVDHVDDRQVYITRWPETGGTEGALIRVPIREWEREMEGIEPEADHAETH